MIKRWLTWVNYLVGSIAILLLLLGVAFRTMRSTHIPVSDSPPPKTALPKGSFTLAKEAYNAIGDPLFSLHFAPMSQQVPDLKKYLIYYGKNGRPDAVAEKPLMHFAFTGNKSISSVVPGQKLYILYDRKINPPQYVFSPNNQETSLWLEARPQDNEASIQVSMRGENGEVLSQPQANAQFALPEKELVRFGGASQWEIGKNRVDATLLARQRARWYGVDLFMNQHGGKEFADRINKQRIDFGEGEDLYSVFTGLEDSMIWENNRWKVVKPGKESLGKPLLVVKKIDERLMNLELWDPEGKGKVILNLLKSTEASNSANIVQQFKFVGARTRTQFVFEINKERVLLSPHDWMLLTKEGWIKLTTPQEIDDYVDRKLTGPLFVFDAVESREGKQYLVGTIYNASRTDMQPIEIPLQQTSGKPNAQKPEDKNAPGKGARAANAQKPSLRAVPADDDDDEESEESSSSSEDEDLL